MIKINAFILFFAAMITLLLSALPARAQCTPGIPCITGKGSGDNAAKSENGSCDADFMNQLIGKAHLESQQDSVTTQALIHKPDSVLEYSCFDQIVSLAAHHAGPLFTETEDWKNRSVDIIGKTVTMNTYMGQDKLDKSLKNLVLTSLKKYTDNNFAHEFLGGRSEFKNTISSTIGGADYNCGHMNAIWHEAKCTNFGVNAPVSTLADLLSNDPRSEPQACPGGTDISPSSMALARNQDFLFATFDQLDTQKDSLSKCGQAVPTGVKVSLTEFEVGLTSKAEVSTQNQDEHVCVAPGCYYDGKACTQ